jgi:hypothetical protein
MKHRTLICLGEHLRFQIRIQDVTQAYLQSACILAREVSIDKPAQELELSPNQALKLLRPLSGLADSGDLRRRELWKHHRGCHTRRRRWLISLIKGNSKKSEETVCGSGVGQRVGNPRIGLEHGR